MITPREMTILLLINLIMQLFCVHIASTSSAENVSMNQTQLVFEEDPLELRCCANRPIDMCEFHLPGFQTNIKLYDGVQNARYEFTGEFQEGVCGIRIFSATADNHGLASCRVSYPDNNLIGEGACNVTVNHFPKNLHLSTNKRNFEFNEGERMEIKCSVAGGFPPPNITLFYDDKLVNSSSNVPRWSKIAEISDFDKKIACIVVHPNATDQRLIYSRIITVNSSPKVLGKTLEDNVYVAERNCPVGQNATLQVPISAYPKPELIEWTRASGERLDRERFRPHHTQIFYKQMSNEWIFGLDIFNASEGDLSRPFRLIVGNELGLLDLNITVKTDSTLENEKIDTFSLILYAFVMFFILTIGTIITVLFHRLDHFRGVNYIDYTSHHDSEKGVQTLKGSSYKFEQTSEHHPQ